MTDSFNSIQAQEPESPPAEVAFPLIQPRSPLNQRLLSSPRENPQPVAALPVAPAPQPIEEEVPLSTKVRIAATVGGAAGGIGGTFIGCGLGPSLFAFAGKCGSAILGALSGAVTGAVGGAGLGGAAACCLCGLAVCDCKNNRPSARP